MRYGAMQSVLREPTPAVFARAAQLGIEGVEIDWHRPADVEPGGPLAPELRAGIRSAAAAAGVSIPSVAAHFLNQGGLASPEPETQQKALAAVRAGIQLCADLGARVLLVPFFLKGDIGGADGVERLRGHLRALAPEAEAAGVVLAIEHTLPAAESAALLDSVGSPFVATYWDMANGVALGYDPLAEIAQLGRRIAQVHAKEWVRDDGPAPSRERPRYDRINAAPFGQGDVPVRGIMGALRQVGYDGWIVLETGAFGDPGESARAAMELLRAVEENSQ